MLNNNQEVIRWITQQFSSGNLIRLNNIFPQYLSIFLYTSELLTRNSTEKLKTDIQFKSSTCCQYFSKDSEILIPQISHRPVVQQTILQIALQIFQSWRIGQFLCFCGMQEEILHVVLSVPSAQSSCLHVLHVLQCKPGLCNHFSNSADKSLVFIKMKQKMIPETFIISRKLIFNYFFWVSYIDCLYLFWVAQ